MDNVVESIFGLSPAQIQQRQNVGMMTAANNYASQDPLQRAAASMFAGGGMLAGAGAQAAGMMTPEMQQAQRTQAIMASGGDLQTSAGLKAKAKQFKDAGDQQIAMRLLMLAQDREAKEAKSDPFGQIAPKDYTPESIAVYMRTKSPADLRIPTTVAPKDKQTNDIQEYEYAKKNNGYKGTLEQWMQRKSQYESMSNEQKLVEAAADAKGLKAGTPERAKFVADAYQKLVDKRTHINVTTTGAQYNLSPEQQNALDKAVTEGRLDPARINSRSAIILANQFTLNPTLDMVSGTADAKTRTAQQAKVGVQLSVLRPFVGMVDKNGEVLKTLADKAIVTNVALANRPINWIEQNIGDHPDMAEFLAQVKIFKDEAARVVSNPNLVGVLSDTARKEMENVISGNMPLKSMRRVIERLQADSHNRISSMEDEYSKIRKQDKAPEVKSTATVSNW